MDCAAPEQNLIDIQNVTIGDKWKLAVGQEVQDRMDLIMDIGAESSSGAWRPTRIFGDWKEGVAPDNTYEKGRKNIFMEGNRIVRLALG